MQQSTLGFDTVKQEPVKVVIKQEPVEATKTPNTSIELALYYAQLTQEELSKISEFVSKYKKIEEENTRLKAILEEHREIIGIVSKYKEDKKKHDKDKN